MRNKELLTALRRLKVATGSLACLGCGHENNCGIHGCAIVREAADAIEVQVEEIERLKMRLDRAEKAVCAKCRKPPDMLPNGVRCADTACPWWEGRWKE